MVSGGDIVSVGFSNITVGKSILFAVAGEDSTFVLGGYEVDDNGAVDGAGRLIVSKNRKPGTFECTISNDMSANTPEFEYCKKLANNNQETTWTILLSNDAKYSGSGVIPGTISLSGNKATFNLKVVSGFGFTKQ
jgi:hypothetical protein